MKIKDHSLETLRGLAILLVVAGYIIRDDMGHGQHSIVGSGLRFIYYCLTPIRMPLFTVISSYLYAASPATRETFKKLVTGKARRIMIPFTVVSTIQYTFFSLAPVKEPMPLHEIYKIYLFPLDQFWFLYSIFWIFVIVGAMDSFKMLETPKKWLACLVISTVLNVLWSPTRLFSIYGVNYLFPFFLMGYGIRRFPKNLFTRPLITAYLTAALFSYAFYVFLYLRPSLPGPMEKIYKISGLCISYSMVPLIMHFRKNVPLFAKIGYYAFGIHIFNKISAALPRLAFQYFHLTDEGLIFFVYMICAVIFSIGLQILMENFNFTRKFVLGIKESPKKPVKDELMPA